MHQFVDVETRHVHFIGKVDVTIPPSAYREALHYASSVLINVLTEFFQARQSVVLRSGTYDATGIGFRGIATACKITPFFFIVGRYGRGTWMV